MGTLGLQELVGVAAIAAATLALLIWVARDARARGMSPALWVGMVFVLHLLGLVVYLLSRQPKVADRVA